MTTNQKKRAIKAQINNKKSIALTFNGKEREGNPHTLGLSGGKLAVRLYQTDGYTSSKLVGNDSPDDFRFFYLKDIDDITEQNTEFKINKSFKSGDKTFDRIDAEVKD